MSNNKNKINDISNNNKDIKNTKKINNNNKTNNKNTINTIVMNNNINDNNEENNNNNKEEKKTPLMKRATAMWLIDNTALSFKQIADFCDLHILEVEGMADGDVATGITPLNPIDNNQLTREMINSCEKDPKKHLELKKLIADTIVVKKSGRKNNTYVPLARRGEKPDGIMYLLKYYPNITDQQIRTLINTTTPMINSIRNRTHWNIKEIRPRDPVILGLCSQSKFNSVIEEVRSNK